MIWLLRIGVLIAAVGLALLAMRASTRPASPPTPVAIPPKQLPTPTQPQPAAARTLAPLPEVVVSRNVRQTPTSRPAAVSTLEQQAPKVAAVEFSYQPAVLTVRPGTTVTWRNSGSEGHDVLGSGPDGRWWSGPLAPTETFQRSFSQAGVYEYLCSFHAEMRGHVNVVL